eukprot:7119563-Prymnesium_polylepis.1
MDIAQVGASNKCTRLSRCRRTPPHQRRLTDHREVRLLPVPRGRHHQAPRIARADDAHEHDDHQQRAEHGRQDVAATSADLELARRRHTRGRRWPVRRRLLEASMGAGVALRTHARAGAPHSLRRAQGSNPGRRTRLTTHATTQR